MNRWLRNIGLAAAGAAVAGALLSGCRPAPEPLPLNLYAHSDIACGDEEIIFSLENPTGVQLFIPASWTGLAVYRSIFPEAWVEYLYPDGFQTMLSTSQKEINYSIPPGTLEPGKYKLVVQGRVGREGTPFSLEVNFTVQAGEQ
ncbi:MAG: hypothetical protein ACOX2G_11825 [Bacillota bacterium]|jgi:hypothetical protein